MSPDESKSVSFDADIKPLFRAFDQKAMSSVLDLWSYADVRGHADAILGQLEAGTMPCDGAWAPDKVEAFRNWVSTGMAP